MKIKTWDYYWEIYISIFVLNENIKNYSKKYEIIKKILPNGKDKRWMGLMRRAEFKNQTRDEKK